MLGKVPDCASIDASSLHMDNENSSDEMGELLCSDLDMPLIPSCIIEGIVELYLPYALNGFTEDDTKDKKLDWLADMYENIATMITMIVLDFVKPQIHSKMYAQTDPEFADNSSHTSITTTSMERNYYSVTEADIEASLGNVFDTCFGDALSVTQERSPHSQALLELVAAWVTERVNRRLEPFTLSSAPPKSVYSVPRNESGYMVSLIINYTLKILKRLCSDNDFVNSEDDGESEDQQNSSCETEQLNGSKCEMGSSGISGPAKLPQAAKVSGDVAFEEAVANTSKEQPLKSSVRIIRYGIKLETPFSIKSRKVAPPEDDGDSEEQTSSHSGSAKLPQAAKVSGDVAFEEAVANTSKEQPQKSSVRTVRYGIKLETPFSIKSRKVAPPEDDGDSEEQTSSHSGSAKLPQAAVVSGDVAFEEAVANTSKEQPQKSSKRTVRYGLKLETFRFKSRKVAPPEDDGDSEEQTSSHSGPAKLPQAAKVSGDVAFEEAVANTSKEQPQKSSKRTVRYGLKLETFRFKSRKVAPSCKINTSLPHTEVVSLENGGTPPPQRRPAIIRMFSSIGRILRKPFTFSLGVRPQDD